MLRIITARCAVNKMKRLSNLINLSGLMKRLFTKLNSSAERCLSKEIVALYLITITFKYYLPQPGRAVIN